MAFALSKMQVISKAFENHQATIEAVMRGDLAGSSDPELFARAGQALVDTGAYRNLAGGYMNQFQCGICADQEEMTT